MAAVNKLFLLGNITRDPELKPGLSLAICEVGLAVNERVKKGDEWVNVVNFFDVTLFHRTAEVAVEYLKKGDLVHFECRIKVDSWEKDGQKRSKIVIVGNHMQMLGGKANANQKSQYEAPKADAGWVNQQPSGVPAAQTKAAHAAATDEIPFSCSWFCS